MLHLSRFKSGFLFGFGAGFVTRDVISNGPSIFRPVVKGFIKAGVILVNKSRESMVNLMENVEDLFAEIRSEQFQKGGRSSPRTSTPPAEAHASKAKSTHQKSKGT